MSAATLVARGSRGRGDAGSPAPRAWDEAVGIDALGRIPVPPDRSDLSGPGTYHLGVRWAQRGGMRPCSASRSDRPGHRLRRRARPARSRAASLLATG